MGLPPYHRNHIDLEETCSVASASGESQLASLVGGFDTFTILPCDSYWALALYSVSVSCFAIGILSYWYIYSSFISVAIDEFKHSRWVEVLNKLVKIREEEVDDYVVSYTVLLLYNIV
jgi:hypothetical protein